MAGYWRVVAVTYEWDEDGSEWLPVVRHELYGPTRKRALEVYAAHLRSDAFLRACVKSDVFAGRVRCRTRVRVERMGRRPS